MAWLSVFYLGLFLTYVIFMLWVRRCVIQVCKADVQSSSKPASLIVVYRNEEEHLHLVLDSIEACLNKHPDLEVLFVDDHSTDAGKNQVLTFKDRFVRQVRSYSLPEGIEGKKAGLHLGIQKASHDRLLFTDADCKLPEDWSRAMVWKLEQAYSAGGSVLYLRKQGFWQHFLQWDLNSLMGLTAFGFEIGKPLMANGANLGYHKKCFHEIVNIHEKEMISGDDVFAVQQIQKKYGKKIFYTLKNPVRTTAPESFKTFLDQRIRWAKKSAGPKEPVAGLVTFFLAIINVLWCTGFVWFFVAPNVWMSVAVLSKVVVDGFFFIPVLRATESRYLWPSYPLVAILHPFYVVTIGLLSLLLPYTWKNRTYKHG
jgi:cellulose synthase/poly-beta-1,6-N-acetylglucosamine synthase-like glycosyltransferase